MLSAIAARKAALAVRQETASPTVEPVPVSEPPSRVQTPPTPKPNSKRKSSSQTAQPSKRKKKEKRAPTKKNTRYFVEKDAFEEQEDVIVIDSEEEESIISDEEIPQLPPPSTSKRKWSPSLPLNDSSDEDEVIIADSNATIPPRSVVTSPDILSTYQPTSEQNMFFLTPTQVSDLGISTTVDGPATLLALGIGETVCLLGTYTFLVLQGSIALSGVTIHASRRPHNVFAPRSSPLPMLECIAKDNTVLDLSKVSQRLHHVLQSAVALVLLQELNTGVEGLGRVCRNFEGVFKPSRLQKNTVTLPLQLSGVHLVSLHFLLRDSATQLLFLRPHIRRRMYRPSFSPILGMPLCRQSRRNRQPACIS